MRYSTDESLIEQVRQAVLNRKLLITAVFLLVVLSGLFATLLITPKYEAGMSLIVSRNRVDPQISPGEKSADVLLTGISDEEFNSELELFKNGEVIAGAIKDLDLINNQAPKKDESFGGLGQKIKDAVTGLFGKSSEDEIKPAAESSSPNNFALEKTVSRVMNNLSVEPVKKSRIIKITYTDTDPLRAKKTLEKIYQEYAALHVRINEKSPATAVFSEQTDEFDRKLNGATSAIKQFDRKNGVTGGEVGRQSEILMTQFYATQAQAEATRTEITEIEQRVRVLKEKIAGQPEQLQTGSQSKYVAALDRMKDELVQLNQQKTQLLQKYKPNTRFVLDIEERIQNVRRAIAEETANPPQERSFALNDLRRRLESDLSNAQIALAGLRTRERDLNTLAIRQRDENARLNGKSIERERLERSRKINEEAYLLYQKKTRESEVGQILNREQVLNFNVVDAPRTDGEKKSPQPLLNLLVLIGLGAIAGLASAIVAEKSFPRGSATQISSPVRRITGIYGMPLLADGSPKPRRRNSARTSSKPSNSTALVPRNVFIEDPDDEKLREILSYYNSKN
ncbi:MAG: hypothetical protein LH472_04400 [Pyrinomonadaceae bacterium]|nr:hypothetical protein [Pyrinomonadaceae bacterium]